MNPDQDYEYYSTQAYNASPEQKTIILTRRLKISSKDAHQTYYESGIQNRLLKQYSKSISQLRKALILNPKSTYGWQDLGLALLAGRRYNESIEVLKKAVKMSPGSKRTHQGLIKAVDKAGKYEELASIYQEISESFGYFQVKTVWKPCIDELVRLKKNKYALQCYKKVFDRFVFFDDKFRVDYARLLHKEGFLQEALEQYEIALQQSAQSAQYRFERPLLKYELMMVEEAVQDLKKVFNYCQTQAWNFDLAVILYHFYESDVEIEEYRKQIESYLNVQGVRESKKELVKESKMKLESESDEKVKNYLVKKIKAMEFVLDWAK